MVKDLFLMDNNKILQKIINTGRGDITVYDDTYSSDLLTGAETYTASFKTSYNDQPLFEEGNYIGFYWQNKFKLMQIKTTESVEYIDHVSITIYAEFAGIELYNNYIDKLISEGPVSKILADILINTNYKVGFVSPILDQESFRVEVTDITSVYTVLQNLTSTFNNCEWEFNTEVINSVTGEYEFYVNCYANGERGTKRYDRFEADRNSYGMKRQGDITNFCSGIIPVGANGITITDLKWEKSQGDPLDKPLGQNYLFDEDAHAKLNNGGKHILMKYKSSATDASSLMWESYYKLQELNKTQFSYEIPVYMTEEKYETIDVGDTNYVVNTKFNPPIQLEARISKFEISFTDRSKNKVTLANFKEVRSKMTGMSQEELVEHLLGKYTGKLTQADIIAIRKYLEQLGVDKSQIDKIIQKYRDNLDDNDTPKDPNDPDMPDDDDPQDPQDPDTPEDPKDPDQPGDSYVGDDMENYRAIKLNNIDNGLWLGDDRIYSVIKEKSAEIVTKSTATTTQKAVSTATATEYKEACEYYKKFWLGNLANSSECAHMRSKSNKYKIYAGVEYWSKKFGLDPNLVYAMIMAESSANPYNATKYSGGGYGLMQCERSCYFGKTQTIKFLDGTTKKFTPSYSTMKPYSCGNITLNGVTMDKAISNQIMFGCHEFRVSLRRFKWNMFASIQGYNFGLYGMDWVICAYAAKKYGLTCKKILGYTGQSSALQAKYFKVLEDPRALWARESVDYRKKYQSVWRGHHAVGTWWYIEGVLRYYKIVDGQLPYVIDDKGVKRGYGANKKSTTKPKDPENTTPKDPNDNDDSPGYAQDIRMKICAKAKEITELHQKYKKATYNASYAIFDDSKRYRAPITWKGIKNPYCYVCSSLSSCAYLYAGLKSVTGWNHSNCNQGTLVKAATAKSGYLMEKLTSSTIDHLLPGDLLMISNGTVPSNLTISWAAAPNGAYRKDKGTHHVIVYMGKVKGVRMIAHASGNKFWPNAIRYEKMFDCYTSSYWYKHAFILRPWDLAKKDKEAAKTPSKPKDPTDTDPNKPKDPTDNVPKLEVTLKGLPGAAPGDFFANGKLIKDITINNIEDDTKYPSTVSHVFCHFGMNCLNDVNQGVKDYISLLKLLMKKYPKKPIFVAKEAMVTSAYGSNYAEINTKIKSFNKQMEAFCNKTKYVIFIKKPSPLVDPDDDSIWNPAYTNKGWIFKNKSSVDKYYAAYKSKILSLATGGKVTRTSKNADFCMITENVITYTTPLNSMKFRMPAKSNKSFYSRVIFTTKKSSSPTKYTQPSNLYLQGKDCKKGQLIPKADTTYSIAVYYNPDTSISTKQYLGSVSGVTKGGKYDNFQPFGYADTLISNAQTFIDKSANFVYNNTTPLDFSNPATNINKWKTDGKYHIDDSAFLNYVLCGWKYSTSHYAKNDKTDIKTNSKVNWALPSIRHEADIAKYFLEKGWILDGADLDNFTNVCAGDILFMDSDSVNNNEFMGISHTAIVTGKGSDGKLKAVECVPSGTNGVFNIKNVTEYTKKNILFIGRIGIYKKSKDFAYADELVAIAKTYYNNAANEYTNGKSWSQGTIYRSSNTPLSGSCEAEMDVTNSFWVKKGTKYYKAIDCSTLVGMALRGYTYENGPYGSKANFSAFRNDINQTNPSVSWAFAVPRTAADIGKFFADKGWTIPLKDIGNAKNNFSGLKKGDLIFWAKKDSKCKYKEPDRFMHISHVAIVYGNSKTYDNRLCVIESTTSTSKTHTLSDGKKVNCGVRIKDLANNKASEIVLVVRIKG